MMGNGESPVDAQALHRQMTVVDGHCDTILEVARGKGRLCRPSDCGHVDLARLQEGGVRVQFFAAFIESSYKPHSALPRALQLIDTFYAELDGCRGQVTTGLTVKQIKKDLKSGKIIAVLGIEGGEALDGDLAVLRIFYRLGVRWLGLTWNQRNQLADGVGEGATCGGLSGFGRQVVKEMNRLGMIVDLAHISETGFWDALELSAQPVMVSHTNCRKLCQHPRNLNDDQIKALAQRGGIMGLSFVPDFLGCGPTGIDDFFDHLDHVAALAGTDVIAIGSDFDGIDHTPAGLEDCRCYPRITTGLLERGYTEKEIRGIMGENMLRLIENVLTGGT